MKTANKQIEILLPEVPELALVSPTPPVRWRGKARAALAAAAWLLRAPRLTRAIAPGAPALDEHAWRAYAPRRDRTA